MALPTLEQYRQGATTWKRSHLGITYTLSHHGVGDYSSAGTWCFYIHLLEEQFTNPEDFAKFDREPEAREFNGSYREHYAYDDVPDYGFHGGITWYSREFYVGRDGERYKRLEIGCDYGHSWDRDGNYWQGLEDVAQDAESLISALVAGVPFKSCCDYCGKYDAPDQFYTARNGSLVHVSQRDQFTETAWAGWLPVEPESPALLSEQR